MKRIFERHRFNLAHGVVCGLIAALMGGFMEFVVGRGELSPLFSAASMAFLLTGYAKFGPSPITSSPELKTALFVSIIWPYLAWKQLAQTIQAPSTTTYAAYVNDVLVGTLSGPDYAAIKLQVLREPRVYLAQVLNIGRIAVKTLDSFVIGVPVFAFWSLLYLAYFEPTVYMDAIAVIQQGPTAIRSAVENYFWLLVSLWMFGLIVQAFLFMRIPGFQNKFDRECNRLLRQKLSVAADGDVILVPAGTVVAQPE